MRWFSSIDYNISRRETMHIHHVAIWVWDLEGQRAFYEKHFAMHAGPKYANSRTGFQSYFLSFESGAQIELMSRGDITERGVEPPAEAIGYAHLSISVGSPEAVDALTARLEQDRVTVVSQPRRTGDGYYEAVILDPEGNRVEIVA
jgi:lactoylglutathione lyase